MSEDAVSRALEAMKREQARHLEEAAVLARKMARVAELQAEIDSLLASAPSDPAEARSDSSRLTIKALVDHYRTHGGSPYQHVQLASRKTYDKSIKQLIRDCGDIKVADLDAQKIQIFYDGWAAGGKIAMSHALITMLRGLARFGMNVLGNTDCKDLAIILHGMRFETAKRRSEQMTETQAENIRIKAHELNRPSIALAQAFQFDCGLKQPEVIGQWIPISADPTPPYIVRGDEKWVRGIRWSEIDENLVLHHPSSSGKLIEMPLSELKMVTAEIQRLGTRPTDGAVIVDERTNLPYSENTFRWTWRKVADAAQVPPEIRNADSRIRAMGPSNTRTGA